MLEVLNSLHEDETGQDLIEYALIGLLIALGAITGMSRISVLRQRGIHEDCWQTNLTICLWKQAM